MILSIVSLGTQIYITPYYRGIKFLNREDPYGTPCYAISELGMSWLIIILIKNTGLNEIYKKNREDPYRTSCYAISEQGLSWLNIIIIKLEFEINDIVLTLSLIKYPISRSYLL